MDNRGIKGLLFDYGGTIDTNGIHWMNLILERYLYHNIPVNTCDFKMAYIFAERLLESKKYIAKDYNFYQVLKTKIDIQLDYLYDTFTLDIDKSNLTSYSKVIANECYRYVQDVLQDTVPVVKRLSTKFKVGIVSNFYGNIDSVLKDFDIYRYFNVIVDSGIEGCRKPNPDIYRTGIERLGLQPEEIVIIGDSFTNDIVPAKRIGCRAVWLNCYEVNQHNSMKCKPDAIIKSFIELEDLL